MHTCGLSGPERPRVPPEGAPGRVGYVRGSRAGRPGLGQSPELFEAAVSRLAHLRGQPLPRDRGQAQSHLVGAHSPDPLTGTPPALEPAANPDLERLPLGRREDGGPPVSAAARDASPGGGRDGFRKGSVVWSLVRGWVRRSGTGRCRCGRSTRRAAWTSPPAVGVGGVVAVHVVVCCGQPVEFAGVSSDEPSSTKIVSKSD